MKFAPLRSEEIFTVSLALKIIREKDEKNSCKQTLTGKSGSRTLSVPTKSPGRPFSFTLLGEMVRLYGASFTSWM